MSSSTSPMRESVQEFSKRAIKEAKDQQSQKWSQNQLTEANILADLKGQNRWQKMGSTLRVIFI